jgi:hypothetical protein
MPAEQRRTQAKVLGSTGAAVPFYDLTFSATKSVSLLQASYAAQARARGDKATADEFEAMVTELNQQAAEHLARKREAAGHNPGPERIRLADGNTAQAGDWIQA